MSEKFLKDNVELHCGDCLDVLTTLPDNSIDSCVTDPPYHLVSIVKRFGKEGSAPINNADEKMGRNGPYHRASAGFMGKQWDGGDIAQSVDMWREVYRVLKPGAHLLAFGGTRTHHRMACAIEDAGFEIRDCIQWLYGSGFPKSHDVSKGIDRAAGAKREVVFNGGSDGVVRAPREMQPGGGNRYETYIQKVTAPATDAARQWEGWGTALKPACEPIVLCRKPLGTGDIDVKRNVELGIRKCGYQGDIIWIEPSVVSAASLQATKPELNTKPVTFAVNANACKTGGGETPIVTRRELSVESGTRITGKSTSNAPNDDTPESSKKSSITTGENALAVEKRSRRSSPSTTLTAAEQSTESQSGDSTTISGGKDSQKAIEPFVGIATGLTGSMECVHIKREGNSFVWPMGLPTFVSSKPLNVAANVLKWGTGAINVDGCRVQHSEECKPMAAQDKVNSIIQQSGRYEPTTELKANGRWPANVIHDGSEEVVAGFPETIAEGRFPNAQRQHDPSSFSVAKGHIAPERNMGDNGSTARFFYTAKADSNDRLGSKHPTVKPLDLMQYLVRLVTPKGGTVLDMFAGTGTTGEAAWREGMKAILIEREAEYQVDIRRRMELVLSGPDTRAYESAKARQGDKAPDYGPLFG